MSGASGDLTAAQRQVLDQQRGLWDAVSVGWQAWRSVFDRGGSVASARLIELAGLRPGSRVLDVGTGIGDPALAAADVVGAAGKVVGVDIAPRMIEVARRRAQGRANVAFAVADAAGPASAGEFDAVLSRWGLMFAPDRVGLLTTLRQALVPGGVLAAAVWGPARTALVVGLAFQVLGERLTFEPSPPGAPGGYSMSDPDQCRAELAAAGFAEISVTEQSLPFWMDSPQEYARFAHDVLPPGVRQMLAQKYGSDDDQETWDAVARLAATYADAGGKVRLPSVALFLRGTNPRQQPPG